ncbi:MAG: phosphoesterase [Acidobacteriota bacterium]|nr:phosphoesterase [Acidobacteriota bacterium]
MATRKLLFVLPGTFFLVAVAASQERQPTQLPTSKTILKPAPGAPQRTNGFPETIALNPDGRYAALLNNGYGSAESGMKQSIAIVDLQTNQVTDFPEDRLGEDAHQSYFVGLAFSSDGAHLYASMGSISDPIGEHAGNSGNGVAVYRFDQGKIIPDRFIKIPLQPLPAGVHVARGLGKLPAGRAIPYPAGLAVIADAGAHNDRLLVANNLSDNVVLLDAESGKELANFGLGTRRSMPSSFPYTVIATRDGKRAWCSLWNASQVVELDLSRKIIVRRIPLMVPKSHVAPGSHPTAMLLSPDEQLLYVALSNADAVAAINARTGTVQAFFSTRLPRQEFGGNETDSLAQSKDGKRLFAANAATNSVAVFDTAGVAQTRRNPTAPIAALGFVPTEWYTLAVAVAGNDLLIATGKGLGTGPNGDEKSKEELSKHKKDYPYIPTLLHGSIARLSLDEVEKNLAAFTRAAQQQMQLVADPTALPFAAGANPIHHVIYIIKENRTYDQIFGDLKIGNGDPALTLYGADITPNQHKLAMQFGVLDNFYDSGEVSGDGHMWSTAAIAGDYNEKTWQIAYRSRERTYDFEGLVADESPLEHDEPDVNEPATGYLWGNVARHKLSYRHYGEFVASEWCEDQPSPQASPKLGTPSLGASCARTVVKKGESLPTLPGQDAGTPSPYPWPVPVLRRDVATKVELRGHFDPRYADFKVEYPDQLRADEFLREFKGFVRAREEKNKAQELPNYVLLRIPNDHTGGTRPGYPTPSASVADNDLAVGRVVDAVSHSPYWEDTAIFIVEDDAQDGADHVDAHRSIALVISKYSQGSPEHPYLEHGFFTTVSMLRTIEALLGLPPMNHNDAYAPVMSDLFTGPGNQPAFDADYTNLRNELIYEINGPAAPGAKESAAMNWRHADEANNKILNSILWRDRKGGLPIPEPQHTVFPERAD